MLPPPDAPRPAPADDAAGPAAPPRPDPEEHARRLYAADRASRLLGIAVTEVADGRATATLQVGPEMLQGHGTCHGGYLFLLADTAFAFACNAGGTPTVAAGADVEFLAPAYEGDVLVAEAVERVRRGRSGVFDVTVRRGEDVLVEFRGRSRALRPAPPTARDGSAAEVGQP